MKCCFEKKAYTLPELVSVFRELLCKDYLPELVRAQAKVGGEGFVWQKLLESLHLELVADYYSHGKSLANTHRCIENWFKTVMNN